MEVEPSQLPGDVELPAFARFDWFLDGPDPALEAQAEAQLSSATRRLKDAIAFAAREAAKVNESQEDWSVFTEGINPHFRTVAQFRGNLVKKFGSPEAAFAALDKNENGELSYGEIVVGLQMQGIPLSEVLGPRPPSKPRKLTKWEMIEQDLGKVRPCTLYKTFRHQLKKRFGSARKAFQALDINCNGELSLGEVQDTLTILHISHVEMCPPNGDIREVFKELDVDEGGELSFRELFEIDPVEERKNRLRAVWRKKMEAEEEEEEEEEEGFEPEPDSYEERLEWLFRNLDADGSGELGVRELFGRDPTRRSSSAGITKRKYGSLIGPMPTQAREERSGWLQRIEDFGRGEAEIDLNISWGCVGQEGAMRLAAALEAAARIRRVETMNLAGNYVGDFGLRKVANAVERFCLVQRLIFSWNSITDIGADRVGKLITMVPTLMVIDLSHNRISDAGAERLAIAIGSGQCAILRMVDLRENHIGPLGIADLRYSVTAANKDKLGGKPLKVMLDGNSAGAVPDVVVSTKGPQAETSMRHAAGDFFGRKMRVTPETRGCAKAWDFNVLRPPSKDNYIFNDRIAAFEAWDVNEVARAALEAPEPQPKGEESDSAAPSVPTSRPSSAASGISEGTVGRGGARRRSRAAGSICSTTTRRRVSSITGPSRTQSPAGSRRPSRGASVRSIPIDMKQLPAGDRWQPGIDLKRAVALAAWRPPAHSMLRPRSRG
eukprot:TRINITY_DN1471_c0_g1_i1.p1 TRINITY_DN1471_c0_g1~~TRINITY_DN1471_c0_g1_i1.p1  ORF type:complete len:721 (-),score=166.09 TRINITY_DN1471_c0_g1_i1:278-2440(-)